MLTVEAVNLILARKGFDLYSGVPCSFLQPLFNYAEGTGRYVRATSEGEAVAIGAGASMAGRHPVILMQNSGLGNAVNPITSLVNIYEIPLLLFVSLRGGAGFKDEPQHRIMGSITSQLLDLMGVANMVLPASETDMAAAVDAACDQMERTQLPYSFVVEKGTLAQYPEPSELAQDDRLCVHCCQSQRRVAVLDRIQAIEAVLAGLSVPQPVVATTGMISRELYTLGDHPNYFYTVGSMGCASGIALGVWQAAGRRAVVLDGDGAALMKLGTMATIGHYRADLLHVILDNESYESTGGQPTVSSTVDFAAVALACGYRDAQQVASAAEINDAVGRAHATPGPHLIHVTVRKGHPAGIGRPTITPVENKLRFREFLSANN